MEVSKGVVNILGLYHVIMKIPIDNESAKEKYDDMCCGQACLSVIQDMPISAIMSQWELLFDSFYGFSKWKDLRKYLEVNDYKVKQIRWNKLEIVNPNSFYILRVQWLGDNLEKIDKPFYGWSWWTEASANTHFIVLHNSKVFCNSDGIFDYDKLSDYLGDRGLITSALEITTGNKANQYNGKNKM